MSNFIVLKMAIGLGGERVQLHEGSGGVDGRVGPVVFLWSNILLQTP